MQPSSAPAWPALPAPGARRLLAAGMDVVLFDKARGPGGRLATRRLDGGQADLGAQYFTVRDPAFAERIRTWQRHGVVARWRPALVELRDGRATPVSDRIERWVGTPRMSALSRHLATGLDLRSEHAVTGIEDDPAGWYIVAAGRRQGPFDRVVLAMPAPQAAALLATPAPSLATALGARPMHGCWAAALAVERPGPAFDAAFVDDTVLRWVARDAAKPGRPDGDTWVAHATAEWSDRWLEAGAGEVLPALVGAFRAATGHDGPVSGLLAHRWRYARADGGAGAPFFHDAQRGLAACGDWCSDSRVESAWISGDRLGAALAAPTPGGPQDR